MAEEKKKRGRPRKTQVESISKSEDKKHVEMVKNENNQFANNVQMSEVRAQMQSVFSKFSNRNLTRGDFLNALGQSFLNNPFVQNTRIKRINAPITGSDKITISKAL